MIGPALIFSARSNKDLKAAKLSEICVIPFVLAYSAVSAIINSVIPCSASLSRCIRSSDNLVLVQGTKYKNPLILPPSSARVIKQSASISVPKRSIDIEKPRSGTP